MADMVIMESSPQKFAMSLIEVLHEKISQIEEEIKDCSTDELQHCEQWVMVLNEPFIEIEDESGFIHVSSLKEKTEEMFCILESLRTSIAKYKSKQKEKMKDEAINNEINKNEKLQFRMEQLDSQIKYFESEEKRLKEKISTLELQKEGLLTRLSEVAGIKVFENNPNIQDLSDTKRPMKLAEAFGELYDNEWTDALEDLLQKQIPERQAIENLRDMLKTIFDVCCTSAKKQRSEIAISLTFNNACFENDSHSMTQTLRRRIKTMQKEASMDVFPFIKEQIDHRINRGNLSKELQKYVDRCSVLSWLMNVQDPPLLLNFTANGDEAVNKMIFTAYTKTGHFVDFVVWPVVMYEIGTVVRKGVLQPK